MEGKTHIEVAYATPDKQVILECYIDNGTSPRDAVRQSGIDLHFPEIDLENCDIGVFGKVIAADYELPPTQKRAVVTIPKEIRRQRAAQGLKMKKGGGALNPGG